MQSPRPNVSRRTRDICAVYGNRFTIRSGCRYCKQPTAVRSLLQQADKLVRDLWRFIENVDDSDPERTDKFFELRRRMREYYAQAGISLKVERAG
jgi:hypothetical protein